MSNPWFRMYSEFAHDPKVQMMNEAMQRRYIMLMCMRCGNVLVTLHETEIAFHLRISNEELAETKALFVSKGFIDDEWNLLNWEKRQFVPDRSAPRVAKHRALQKAKQQPTGNVTHPLLKRETNALDTDTDTDTDKKEDKKTRANALDIPDALFSDFMSVRKAKRSGALTKTAAKAIQREADKAGLSLVEAVTICCEKSWTTFDSAWNWKQSSSLKNSAPAETTYQRSMRERVEEFSPSIARQAPDFSKTFIEEVRDVTVIASH